MSDNHEKDDAAQLQTEIVEFADLREDLARCRQERDEARNGAFEQSALSHASEALGERDAQIASLRAERDAARYEIVRLKLERTESYVGAALVRLRTERDEALERLQAAVGHENADHAEIATLREGIAKFAAERDTARDEAARLTGENEGLRLLRDGWAKASCEFEAERDALRAELAASVEIGELRTRDRDKALSQLDLSYHFCRLFFHHREGLKERHQLQLEEMREELSQLRAETQAHEVNRRLFAELFDLPTSASYSDIGDAAGRFFSQAEDEVAVLTLTRSKLAEVQAELSQLRAAGPLPPAQYDRESLGRLVRDIWLAHKPMARPAWIFEYEEMCRLIGEGVASFVRTAGPVAGSRVTRISHRLINHPSKVGVVQPLTCVQVLFTGMPYAINVPLSDLEPAPAAEESNGE
jgi:hypothetical protein